MSENETIQISETYIRWMMINHIEKIFREKNFRKTLSKELKDLFNLNCLDIIIGYRNKEDIYSEEKTSEITISHGLISVLLVCDTVKILIQGKGILIETKKENYIFLITIDHVFIK